MFCEKCGTEYEEGARFCRVCGNARVKTEENAVQDQVPGQLQKEVPLSMKEDVPVSMREEVRKKYPVWLFAVLFLLLALSIGGIIWGVMSLASPEKKYEEQLELAQRYLDELDYDRAIAAYRSAIEILPERADAYLGLASVYEELEDYENMFQVLEEGLKKAGGEELEKGLADCCLSYAETYADKGDYDSAISTLERGLALVDDVRLKKKKEEYEELKRKAEEERRAREEREKLVQKVQPVMERLGELAFAKDWDGVFNYMQSDEYEDFLQDRMKLEDAWLFETEYGEIGFYQVNDQKFGEYMLYYGDFSEDKKREGTGDWFGYYDGNNYHGHGEWKDDLPQGHWDVKEWSTQLAEDVVYRLLNGTVVDGLWDGIMEWNFDYHSEDGINVNGVIFDHGKWVPTEGPDEDGGYMSCAEGYENGIHLDEDDMDDHRGIVGYEY